MSEKTVVGSGNIITEERTVDSFNKIHLKGYGDIYLTQGDKQSVQVRSDDNIMPYICTCVKDETLLIAIKDPEAKDCCRHKAPPVDIREAEINIYTTIPKIKGLFISGDGDLEGENEIKTDTLDLEISGSGDMELDVCADEINLIISGSGDVELDCDVVTLNTKITGSGDVELSGQVDTHHIIIEGSGDVEAFELTAKNCKINIPGSGDCDVNVSNQLDINISGSGDVDYMGEPNLTKTISGSGYITKSED